MDCSDPLRPTSKRTSSFSSTVSPKKLREGSTHSTNMFEVIEPESEISEADNVQNLHWRNDDDDPVLLFFKSMAMTVKTFEPQVIPEVKSRIFNIINEFEVKAIQKKYGSSMQIEVIREVSNPDEVVVGETSLNIEDKYSHTSSFHHSNIR